MDVTLQDADSSAPGGGGGGTATPRGDVFAPHDCRYRLYSRRAASQCFRDQAYSRVLFHGDSMVRSIFGEQALRWAAWDLCRLLCCFAICINLMISLIIV